MRRNGLANEIGHELVFLRLMKCTLPEKAQTLARETSSCPGKEFYVESRSVLDAALDVFLTLPGDTSTREDDGQPMVEVVMRVPVRQTGVPTHALGPLERVKPGKMDKDEHTKERCFMTELQIVYLLRPGTQERWRRLCQEVEGLHKEQFEACCGHIGISRVQVRLVQLLHSDLMLITLHMHEPHQALKALVNSERPFDGWLRAQLQFLLGWNLQDVLPDPQGDLIFTWGP